MKKSDKKWGFLAPTRAEAERMEAKYGVHFTPLIDYMKVIFPDIDDWEENDIIEDGIYLGGCIFSYKSKKTVIVCMDAYHDIVFTPKDKDWCVYYIKYAVQLTNATVKQIFGVEVKKTLFDENTPTITQPWIKHRLDDEHIVDLEGRYVGDEKQYQVNSDAYRAKYDNIGLTKIIVDKLFGLFSYEIDLSADKNISILIGPNGCGKTTIFKIVRFMLSGDGSIEEIIKIPFKNITCELANGRKVKLKSLKNKIIAFIDNKSVATFYEDKDVNGAKDTYTTIWANAVYEILKDSKKDVSDISDISDKDILDALYNMIFDMVKDIKGMSLDNQKKAYRKLQQIEEEIAKERVDTILTKRNFTNTLKKCGCYFDTEFISAQRLFREVYDETPEEAKTPTYIDNISKIKEDFRLFCMTDKQLSPSTEHGEIRVKNVRFVFFKLIINNIFRITKKQIHYRKGEMYLTIGEKRGKKEIPLEVLSSGEKNIFVMFYNLIFKFSNCKIFIDEPEISLHIEWQERFINDLYSICEINNIQALVATHSPNIINDHTDLIAKWDVKDGR